MDIGILVQFLYLLNGILNCGKLEQTIASLTPTIGVDEVIETELPASSITIDEHTTINSAAVADWPLNDQAQYVTIREFEQAMLGVCPQDVPTGVWPDPLAPSVSLGILNTTMPGDEKNAQIMVRVLWNQFKSGQALSDPHVLMNAGEALNGVKNRLALVFHWSERYVGWDYLWESDRGKLYIEPALQAELEELCATLTEYLRTLDQQFYEKCGY